MKAFFLILCLLTCVSAASWQKLQDIQIEMSYLIQKRQLLTEKITNNRKQEINEELSGAKNMLEFDWEEFVSELKNAQKYEMLLKEDRAEVRRIDQRLLQLATEAGG